MSSGKAYSKAIEYEDNVTLLQYAGYNRQDARRIAKCKTTDDKALVLKLKSAVLRAIDLAQDTALGQQDTEHTTQSSRHNVQPA